MGRRTAIAIVAAIFVGLAAIAWHTRFDRDWLSRLHHEALVVFVGLAALWSIAWPVGLLARGRLADRRALGIAAAGLPLAAVTYLYARDAQVRPAPTAALAALVVGALAVLAWRDRRP